MNPKVLFTAEEIVAACEAAKSAGDATYSTVFTIAPGGRSSANGATHYFDLYARAGGKEGKLFLRFKNERFAGRIQPLTGGEYTRDPTRTPTLGIRKYTRTLPTMRPWASQGSRRSRRTSRPSNAWTPSSKPRWRSC